MEEKNDNKNVANAMPLAEVNGRIDMNKVAEYYARINDLRGDIMEVAERLLSLYVVNDKDYYETAIEEHLDRLGKVVGELCGCILSLSAWQHEKR